MGTAPRPLRTALGRLQTPVDIASLAVFRILFGLLMLGSVIRFGLSGWIDDFFVQPTFFFQFPLASFVTPLPAPWMVGVMVALGALSVLIALGLFYRVAIVSFTVLFTWVELIDVTNYLNHYYLVTLLGVLLSVLPAGSAFSLDVRWRPERRRSQIPLWMLALLRTQVGVVYVFAALAKFNPDWLLHAQPLNIWLSARTDTPLIGPWLAHFEVALAMSWMGFLYDLLIVPALLWRRTRAVAWGVALCFHTMTGILFNIGMFPFIMTVATTVFFAPAWPRRFLRSAPSPPGLVARAPRWARTLAIVWCAVQIAVPLRFLAYPGPVNWHEQGMRFAWKVMVREKNGTVSYRVALPDGRTERVPPRRYLTDAQEREMGGQPDLILQLAHHVARDYESRGIAPVRVYVDAFASLNGRPPARLLDPTVDLAAERDGLAPKRWILPAPTTRPIRLRPARDLTPSVAQTHTEVRK